VYLLLTLLFGLSRNEEASWLKTHKRVPWYYRRWLKAKSGHSRLSRKASSILLLALILSSSCLNNRPLRETDNAPSAIKSSEAAVVDVNEESPYLKAVREFADNVLKYGRDTYGPKHTPLFVDGLNIHTHEPVKWIAPNGDRWVLSNLASQQNLFRTLDGLTRITGDPKYKQAAMEAIEYAFEHLRSPNGLLYWGHIAAYDASVDKVRGQKHCLKLDYPHYELMWKVDPGATKKFIEAYWSTHIIDWSNLDMNRIGNMNGHLEDPWSHEYIGGSTFFKSKISSGGAFISTGSSLIYSGVSLYRYGEQVQPLIWSKRLAKRYVDTRHPKTGISAYLYNDLRPSLGDDFDLKEHFVNPHTTIFPLEPFEETRYIYYPETWQTHPWISLLLIGDMLGGEGRQFSQWVLEEFTAWGKAAYRKEDNSFVPLLTDGTIIEGYVPKEAIVFGLKGKVAKPYFADLAFYWAYAMAYRKTGDEFMWKMTRNIVLGNSLGDIGKSANDTPKLQADTICSSVYGLFGFLELYKKTSNLAFLHMAQRIGDNILAKRFHKGFFMPGKDYIYTRFDCLEPLALLHLHNAAEPRTECVPRAWPGIPLFKLPYRFKPEGIDRRIIYTLIESPEPPLSIQEAATVGDVELVRSLIVKGVGVDSWDNSFLITALHCSAINDHKDVAELLLAEGADINIGPKTALHYAAQKGHKEVAELLISKDANVNARNVYGDTPLHEAARAEHEDIIRLLIDNGADVNVKNNEGLTPADDAVCSTRKMVAPLTLVAKLLIAKGADISIVSAVHMEDLDKAKELIQKGASINVKDKLGRTALHYAAGQGHKEMVELLLANGAEVNAGTNFYKGTPAEFAMSAGHNEVVELLISKGADISPLHFALNVGDMAKAKNLIESGADVNKRTPYGTAPLHRAVDEGFKNIVELLIAHGADVNAKDNWNWTVLHSAVRQTKDIVELLIVKGANVDARDGDGRTPLWYAQKSGRTEMVELLRKHGARE